MRPAEQQVVLVTGATDGLGRRLAERLAGRGATVLLHGRSAERLEAARSGIAAATGSERLETWLADFASLAEVRRLAGGLRERHERLDALVNNAGVIVARRSLSADGHELTFAVNHLAHFLLTLELLPLLAPPARVVNVASAAQERIDLEDPMMERGYEPRRAYARSKLAQLVFTVELAERRPQLSVNALHPASLMDTKMVREHYGAVMTTVDEGAAATLRLVLDPALDGTSGRYFDGLRESRPHAQAADPVARRRLWELSERLTGAG